MIATDVVGATTALMAMPKPRPRRMTPVPRSNGCDHANRSKTVSSTLSNGASLMGWPVAWTPPSRSRFFRRNSAGSSFERARHHVHVAFVGPDELGHAKATQRAGRCDVRVDGVGADIDVFDVVRTGGRYTRLLRHARTDVGVGAAVPEHFAFSRDDPAVLVDAALDAERAGMFGDLVEHLLHGGGDLHRRCARSSTAPAASASSLM